MAMVATSSYVLLILCTFALLLLLLPTAAAGTAAVGGRTEIQDVGSNREVQSLGRFAVAEHNRRALQGAAGGEGNAAPALLAFSRVAAAQRQVVAGVAYYLRVVARDRAGGEKAFDAVVVVKAWLKSKELVSFTPSPK